MVYYSSLRKHLNFEIMSCMEQTLSSQQATDWREGRRLRAWELKQEGWKQRDIARALGVSKGAVSQWMKRAQQEGQAGPRCRPQPFSRILTA
jgi:hypothetical protein